MHLHELVGNALEQLYQIQEESLDIAGIAVQLALHYQKAWVTGKAIRYLQQAGERAMQLSAFKEAVAHLTSGMAMVMSLPASPERARQELALQTIAGYRLEIDLPDSEGKKLWSERVSCANRWG